MELGKYIARQRKLKGLSQENLAELLNVSRQAISKWERGIAVPSTENLFEMSKVFGVPVDDFFVQKHDVKMEDEFCVPGCVKEGVVNRNRENNGRRMLRMVGLLLLVLVTVSVVFVVAMSR